jgi:hypothetical protein
MWDIWSDYSIDSALEQEFEVIGYHQNDGNVKTHNTVPENGFGILIWCHFEPKSSIENPILLWCPYTSCTSQASNLLDLSELVESIVVIQSQESWQKILSAELGAAKQDFLELWNSFVLHLIST